MAHLGEKLKSYRIENSMNQTQMADYIGVGFRTYQDMEKTGVIKKSGVLKKIKDATGIDTQIIAQSEELPKKIKGGGGDKDIIDLRGRTIYNLSEGNRIQSETTAQLADSNQKLIDQNITLTRAAIGGADQQTFEETVLMVKGMRDFLIEFAADIKKVNPQEVLQALYSKVKEVKDQSGKTDNRAETSTRSR